MNLTIISNGQPRDLKCLADLPKNAQKDFDYIEDGDEFEPRFIHYKHAWYDTRDVQGITTVPARMGWAMVVKPDEPLAQWHAIVSETFFSGILFRYVGDQVIVGRYYS